jgi:hypothetical protein
MADSAITGLAAATAIDADDLFVVVEDGTSVKATGTQVATLMASIITPGDIGASADGAVTASGLTMTTARLLGRTTASTGAVEEITVGAGLTLAAGALTATGGAVDSDDVTYTPTTLADWDSSADPGDVEQALDQLAERVADVEGAISGGDEQYDVDGTPATDDTYAGRAITGVNAGATIAQWEAVYMGSGGEWLLADANGSGTYPCRGIAAAAGTDNNPMTVVTEGVIRNDAWSWTAGGQIYLSATAGGLTQSAPATSGDKVQQVGFAISADVMYLCIGAATFIELD